MNNDDRILEVLRSQAWERAKGELQSILETFWPEYDSKGNKIPNGYDAIAPIVKQFIDEIDDQGL